MNSSSEHLRLLRWMFVGAIVPSIFTAIEYVLLMRLYPGDKGLIPTLVFFVFQVGVLGVLCGRLIDWPLLRWLIYGWCWLLIDLQLLLTSAVVGGSSIWKSNGESLFNAMFVGQLSLVVIWGVLGTSNWVWRLPLSIVLGTLAAVPLADEYDYTYAVQTAALASLGVVLRWRRFRLVRVPVSTDAAQSVYKHWKLTGSPSDSQEGVAVPTEPVEELQQVQFGIRHVLVWTTSLAIALGFAKAMDLLNLEALQSLMGNDWMALLCNGLLAAIVLIVSMWAALGAGPAWVRWPLLAVFAIGGGIAADVFEKFSYTFGSGIRLWDIYWGWGHIILVRYVLTASLLFATLLIFRTLGYRIQQSVRKQRIQPATTA